MCLAKILVGVLTHYSAALWAIWKACNNILTFSVTTGKTKVFWVRLNATLANSFLLMSCILLVISKNTTVVQDLSMDFYSSVKSTSVLYKTRQIIFKTIFMLILASKKYSLKNQILSRIFWSEKPPYYVFLVPSCQSFVCQWW